MSGPDHHPADHELLLAHAGERPAATIHLEGCSLCRERLRRLITIERAVMTAGRDMTGPPDIHRRQLRARLGQPPAPAAPRRSRGALAAVAVLVALATWRTGGLFGAPGGARRAGHAAVVRADDGWSLPIRAITPGATVALAADELCRQPPVPAAPIPEHVRARVLRAYGMEQLADHEYELDYLITPALGGAPDPRNLWPEPYRSPVWNARVKDELEDLLPQLVCDGKVDLRTAQQEIAADWIAAYKKYFKTDRPLPRT